MVNCGAIDDVYAYEKMKRTPADSSSDHNSTLGLPRRLAHHSKGSSFRDTTTRGSFSIEVPESPSSPPSPSAKISSSSRMTSRSLRWIARQIKGGTPGHSKRMVTEDTRAAELASPSVSTTPPTPLPRSTPQSSVPELHSKPKDVPKPRIGMMDILLGYSSLLQMSPLMCPSSLEKRQYYPTIGFIDSYGNGKRR